MLLAQKLQGHLGGETDQELPGQDSFSCQEVERPGVDRDPKRLLRPRILEASDVVVQRRGSAEQGCRVSGLQGPGRQCEGHGELGVPSGRHVSGQSNGPSPLQSQVAEWD